MNANSRPLVVLYNNKTTTKVIEFLGRKGIISVSGKIKTLQKILSLCNGLNNVEEIIQNSNLKKGIVLELISFMCENGIIKDSRELYLDFHQDSSNPTDFDHNIDSKKIKKVLASNKTRERGKKYISSDRVFSSNLTKIIKKRKSVRVFKKRKISLKKIFGILNTTYGENESGNWSVASGGALYPLDIYLIVTNNDQVLPKGVYQWDPRKKELGIIRKENTSSWIEKAFNAKSILENSAFVICITANLNRSCSKYSNRGYRLILLEAGHAAQNTYLFCSEQNLGTVECCGFNDYLLAKKIGLKFPYEVVLTTLIVGVPDKNSNVVVDQETSKTAGILKEKLVGKNRLVSSIDILEPEISGDKISKLGASTRYKIKNPGKKTQEHSAFATGVTTNEVTLKVLAEAYERYSLEQNNYQLRKKATELKDPFLDPRVFIPFSNLQIDFLKNLYFFDPNKKTDWVLGKRISSGEKIWVPKELVYYNRKKRGTKTLYDASSSGVAAHTEIEKAIESGLLELIERDAFMFMWITKKTPKLIPRRFLSESICERIKFWQKNGYKVLLFDLTIDGPPVVLTIIWSKDKIPALSSGSSCKITFIDAVESSFDEAEFMAASWQDRKINKEMKMSDVTTPELHGLFYSDPKNLKYIQHVLKSRDYIKNIPTSRKKLEKFDPIVVDITPTNYTCGLIVVRVLSEKLIPINFGYGNEHYLHPRIRELGFMGKVEYPSDVHFFA